MLCAIASFPCFHGDFYLAFHVPGRKVNRGLGVLPFFPHSHNRTHPFCATAFQSIAGTESSKPLGRVHIEVNTHDDPLSLSFRGTNCSESLRGIWRNYAPVPGNAFVGAWAGFHCAYNRHR
jgi:hypothetical protein